MRSQRELCCDELAVAATGQRLTYASALERAYRGALGAAQPALTVGLGTQKKTVLPRVRHVLGLMPELVQRLSARTAAEQTWVA